MKIRKTLKVLATSALLFGTVGLGTITMTSCGNDKDKIVTTDVSGLFIEQNGKGVSQNFSLPSTYLGAEITWTSSNTALASIAKDENGILQVTLNRTSISANTDVTLTAKSGSSTKNFTITVVPVDASEIADNYAFSLDGAALGTGEYTLPTVTTSYLGKTATITWAVSENTAAKIVNGVLVVEAPEEALGFTLTGTFSYNGETSTKKYKLTAKYIDTKTSEEKMVDWYALAYDTESVTINGYVLNKCEVKSGSYIVQMIDESYTGGIYCYYPTITADDFAALQVGTAITLTGATAQSYNGLIETDSGKGAITLNTELPAFDATKATTAIDDLLFVQDLTGPDSLFVKESTLVTLSGWKVTAVTPQAEVSTAGSNADLVTLSKTVGDTTVNISLQYSKYYTGLDTDLSKEIGASTASLAVGDFVNVTGFLSCYKSYQIVLTSASAITKVSSESTVDVSAIKEATAVFGTIELPSNVTSVTTIDLNTKATAVAGSTISWKVFGIGSALTDANVLTLTPSDSSIRTVTVIASITVGGKTFQKSFEIVLSSSTADPVQNELDAIELPETTDMTGSIKLPEAGTTSTDVVLTYALTGTPTTAVIKEDELFIVAGETAETVKVTATATQGEKVLTKEFTIEVAARSASVTDLSTLPSTTTGVYYTGVVGKITSDKYGNTTLTNGETSVVVYGMYGLEGNYEKLATKPVEGDTVVLYGTYSAEYKNMSSSKVISVNGIQTVELPTVTTPVDPVNNSATAEYTGTVTSNLVADENNAKTLGLDPAMFTVSSSACVGSSYTNYTGVNKDGTIRLYTNAEKAGNILTITIASGYTIKSITINFKQNGAQATVKSGTSVLTGTDGLYTVNGSSFSIQNTGESGQIHINSIEIVFEAVSA